MTGAERAATRREKARLRAERWRQAARDLIGLLCVSREYRICLTSAPGKKAVGYEPEPNGHGV